MIDPESQLATALAHEHTRLVRLCASLTGDRDAAEDLAQETLVEAWRMVTRLHDPSGMAPWLTAIARNVCSRWKRSQGHRRAHETLMAGASGDPATGTEPAIDITDMTRELERGELADLLDRALVLLPTDTRAALIGSYVHELPNAELATRLGMSEGALRVRLHRGKLALQRLLATELRDEAANLGIALPPTPAWQTTRIWCPFCGRYRLKVRVDYEAETIAYHCAGPCNPHVAIIGIAYVPAMLRTLSSPKSILTRLCLALSVEYRQALAADHTIPCAACGQPMRYQFWQPEDHLPDPLWRNGIHATCPACGHVWDAAAPWHLAIDTPAAIQFWRRHPRIRALPTQEIDFAGCPALVTGFASIEDQTRLELISARDTYEVLRVIGEGGQ